MVMCVACFCAASGLKASLLSMSGLLLVLSQSSPSCSQTQRYQYCMRGGGETVFHGVAGLCLSFSGQKHPGHSKSSYVQWQHQVFEVQTHRYQIPQGTQLPSLCSRDRGVRPKETYIFLLLICAGLYSSKCRNITCTRRHILEPCETSLFEIEASQVYQISNTYALGTETFYNKMPRLWHCSILDQLETCPSLVWD